MSEIKDKYVSLVSKREDVPIFLQPWWLDAVVEKNSWDVVFVEDQGLLKACFVYVLKKKGPFISVGMPGLTPFLGFWFTKDIEQSQADKLLSMLLKHSKFYVQMSHIVFNLDFDSSGYTKEIKHTYTLSEIKDHDTLYANFKQRIKGEIKKAQRQITVRESSDVKLLYTLCQKSYKRQDKEAEFSLNLVENIYRAVTDNNCGTILLAEDEGGNAHAATLIVWDHQAAYYLLNGGDPELRSSGANSLLMWEAIKHSSKYVDTFDFEGSMIPGVEKYIQGYNPEKRQYALFTKTNSKFIVAAEGLKKALGER